MYLGKLVNPNKEKIRNWMRSSYTLRRIQIISKFDDEENVRRYRYISEIMQLWPALRMSYVVSLPLLVIAFTVSEPSSCVWLEFNKLYIQLFLSKNLLFALSLQYLITYEAKMITMIFGNNPSKFHFRLLMIFIF